MHWEGVFPAVTTKFTDTLAIDTHWMRINLEAQLDAGATGIIVSGSLGEASTLSMDDKEALVNMTVEIVEGRAPVVCGVAQRTTADACRMAERVARAGGSGLMLLPPMLYTSDRRETVTFLRAVANATDLPIMLYNNPVAYNVDVTPSMLQELADEPKFEAIKESSDDVRRITDIINLVGDRYRIFTGVDNIALEALMLGAVGWVAGLVCAFPRETVAIFRLAKAGRFDEAVALYRWFMPLLHLDVNTKLVQNIKLAEAMVGLGTETVRPPRLPLVGEEREAVMATIQRALDTRPAEAVQAVLA
ncbi:MAG: dihydrodipicolinate synthase family protein [Rhodothermales bacterium]|nr:dihydrodipicolinate synthase family protein [Rhodothermales bacterium]MBO6778920.1 dihydrodipicolinate synthase family protein [Rhodothermales bacterium]